MAAISIPASVYAQNLSDALRYSTLDFASTARTSGVAGAFAAMGGDFSIVGYNPAGLGEFRKSEFTLTPSLYHVSTESVLGDNATERSRTRLSLDNIGLVFNHKPIASNWKSTNFAIGFNRLANFNQKFEYSGATVGSITERFLQNSDGLTPEELDVFGAQLAYITGAILDPDADDGVAEYISDFDDPSQLVQKRQVVESSGGIHELVVGLAGNLENKLSIGATLGVPFVSYEEEKTYMESDDADEISVFDNLEYNEFLTTSGVGINAKLGLIYKVTRQFRIGGAIHSPTYFFLTDDFSTNLTYAYTDGSGPNEFTEPSPDGNFKWRLSTPWRAVGGMGVLLNFGKVKGFLDADVEWVDYASNDFNLTANSDALADQLYEDELNADVEAQLKSTANFKVGGELVYDKLRLRLGYAAIGSPFQADDGNAYNSSYSAGIGIRENRFFLDFAFQRRETENGFIPYTVNDASRLQVVQNDRALHAFKLTLGFKI